MKLYVIRHGESENNQKNIYTGWAQVNLSEKGYADARSVGERILSHVSFDQIYTSDLKRAMQTAETALPGCRYETTPLLREYNVGTLQGSPGRNPNVKNRDYTPFGGENAEMVRARIIEFMRLVEEKDVDSVAAFSHAGLLCTMLSVVLGVEISGANISCANCTVAIFEYQKGKWTLHSWINP